jgi:hypothetical protein
MIVDDDDGDERKLYKIENYQESRFQNFSSRIVFFLNIFDFSKNIFQNFVKRGMRGGAGWCKNMKAQRTNSKLEFKVFFKVLKFLSLFSQKNALSKKLVFEISWREQWGRGGDET